MAGGNPHLVVDAIVVEEEITFTLGRPVPRLRRRARMRCSNWSREGVLEPVGSSPDDWRFSGPSLRTARAALRLRQALELGPGGAALVLDLLDEIEHLRARLRRAGLS